MSNVLFAICMAVVIVGTIETTYQIYKLIILDASARGLKHPKLWGLLAIFRSQEHRHEATLQLGIFLH